MGVYRGAVCGWSGMPNSVIIATVTMSGMGGLILGHLRRILNKVRKIFLILIIMGFDKET
jgi:hypothetical protein